MTKRREIQHLDLFRKRGTTLSDGLGIIGLTVVSEEFGGAWLDPLSVGIAHEELSYILRSCILSMIIFGAFHIMWPHFFHQWESDEQRRRWLGARLR